MSTYAIVQVGTHQYRVEEKSVLEVERFELPKGNEVKLDQVLLVQKNSEARVGTPFVEKASVTCELAEEFRTPKVISFKFKKRKGFRKKKGHRQTMLRLRVKSIQSG
jgi:large subunit ribosomal protein L21